MAHIRQELVLKARHLYVSEALPLSAISARLGVTERTLTRWKSDARKKGIDWDTARADARLFKENIETATQASIGKFMALHQRMLSEIETNNSLSTAEKVAAIASLTDAHMKAVKAHSLAAPSLSRLEIAGEILTELAMYVSVNNPSIVPSFVSILEPFGKELDKRYNT